MKKERGEILFKMWARISRTWIFGLRFPLLIIQNRKTPISNSECCHFTYGTHRLHRCVNKMNFCVTEPRSSRQMLSLQKFTELWKPLIFLFLPSSDIISYYEMFGGDPSHTAMEKLHSITTVLPSPFFLWIC